MRILVLPVLLTATLVLAAPARAAGAHADAAPLPQADGRTPEQRMNARFPQKVRAGDLVGLPVQDVDDRILGYVTDVIRRPDGRIVLVMPEGGLPWRAGRLVPIPIETVAILARHLNLLDIPREEVPRLPTWDPKEGAPIARDDIIRIAIGSR